MFDPHFIGNEIVAQDGKATCPGSHSKSSRIQIQIWECVWAEPDLFYHCLLESTACEVDFDVGERKGNVENWGIAQGRQTCGRP